MPKIDEMVELDLVDSEEDEAYVEYDIVSYPSDHTIEGLHSMLQRGDIVVPPYQRKYVWTINQASILVESFLLGLPVPPLFFYINDENKSEVVDGQQRLLSMSYFLSGYFGPADDKDKRKVFKLTGLSEKSPFKGKSFEDLDEKYQRKLNGGVLRSINIKQMSPAANNTSVFHIFERLNTGGTSLKPQEIRNAVFRGDIVSQLQELNNNPNWRTILGSKKLDRYQRDVELVLRLFALCNSWSTYEKPMKEFLNLAMKANKSFNTQSASNFAMRFPEVAEAVIAALGNKPFRPKRVINAAVLESVMIAMLEDARIDSGKLIQNYDTLMVDQDFSKAIRGATTDTNQVHIRISKAKEILAR